MGGYGWRGASGGGTSWYGSSWGGNGWGYDSREAGVSWSVGSAAWWSPSSSAEAEQASEAVPDQEHRGAESSRSTAWPSRSTYGAGEEQAEEPSAPSDLPAACAAECQTQAEANEFGAHAQGYAAHVDTSSAAAADSEAQAEASEAAIPPAHL